MNFQQILDVTAMVAAWSVMAVAIWWWLQHGRRKQAGPRWINPVIYVGQVILTADAWIDPDSQWLSKIVITTGLVILTGLHLFHAYTRWEHREREKAYAKLAYDRMDSQIETNER